MTKTPHDGLKSLYPRLVEAGCEIDHHESDLYVKATPQARAIILAWEAETGIKNRETFKSAIDGSPWYDIPFAYDPFWSKKAGA